MLNQEVMYSHTETVHVCIRRDIDFSKMYYPVWVRFKTRGGGSGGGLRKSSDCIKTPDSTISMQISLGQEQQVGGS